MERTYFICALDKKRRLIDISTALYRLETAPTLSDILLCLALCWSRLGKDYIKENGIVALVLYSGGFGKDPVLYLDSHYFSKGAFDI